MAIGFNLAHPHKVVAANSHYYKEPTEVLYIDRVLPHHDLIYLVEGGWMITENGVDYPLEKDDVLLLAAGRHHYTRLPSLPETRTICIHITCEAGDGEDGVRTLALPSLLHMKGAPEVKRYFEEIVATLWSEKPHKQERMSALFTLLALELYERQAEKELKRSAIADEVVRIINATPHKRYKLAEIAEMLYVSTKTLENAMRKSVGMSFAAFQNQRKLEMAALQLEIEPDVRLKEIALAFGFCDEFHMSKAFKQQYGVSPQQYKREKLAKAKKQD